jgi:tetratricopeptide (TPR) repeat protein
MEKRGSVFLIVLCFVSILSSDPFEGLVHQDPLVSTKAENYYLYFRANREHMGGKLQDSLRTYNRLLQEEVRPHVSQGYLRLLFDTNQFAEVVKVFDKAKNLFEGNLDLQLMYAQSLLSIEQDKKAEGLLEELMKKYPEDARVVYYSAVYDIKQGRLDEALSELKTFLEKTKTRTKHFLFYFLKSKIYLQKGDVRNALKAIDSSLSLYPRFDKGWLLRALLMEQSGMVNEAVRAYRQYIAITGPNPQVEKQLVRLLFGQRKFGEALDHLKKIRSNHHEYYFDLALLSWKAGRQSEALRHVSKAMLKRSDFKKAKLLKVEILLSVNRQKEALALFEGWLKESPRAKGVVQALLLLRNNGVSVGDIEVVLQKLQQRHPREIVFPLALADLSLEQDNDDKALRYYDGILKESLEGFLRAKVQFQVAYVKWKKGKHQEAKKELESIVKEKEVYPSSYNLLAFCYEEEGIHLKEALRLIELGLAKRPMNPYYLHTRALISLKLGKKKDARRDLDRAHELLPDDTKIKEALKKLQK